MGSLKLKIDRDKCIGSGKCTAIAPEIFVIDDRNKVLVKEADKASAETLLHAAEQCPSGAIYLIDEETRKQVYPTRHDAS